MLIEEIYDLYGLVLKHNKRELKLSFKGDILKGNIKPISVERSNRKGFG